MFIFFNLHFTLIKKQLEMVIKKVLLQNYIELFAGWQVFVITESGRIQTLSFVLSKARSASFYLLQEKNLSKPQCNGKTTESQNGLERASKIMQFQAPCHKQGHISLNQVDQSYIQPGLEHLHVWSIPDFSGQRVPVPHHLYSKELSPNTLFYSLAVSRHSPLSGHCMSL